MFGGKFRIWMEAHIVRPKKKNQRGKETPSAGVGVEVGEGGKNPPPPPQATATPAPAPPVTGGGCKHSCSSGSGGSGGSGGGGSLEAMLSSGAAAPGASLSSPESAYSTGYSTDGTSPGASYPPEYYINIRTGTHYFQQAGARGPPPAPPPRVPAVKSSPSPPKQVDFAIEKSPAVQKKELPKRCIPSGHRRSESCDVGRARVAPQLPHVPPPPPLAASPSPRQRSRIRTNPWLGGAAPARPGHSGAEDSCNGSSCSSARLSSGEGVSVSVKQPVKKVLGPCREASPVVRSPAPSVTWSPRRLNKVAASSSSSGSQRSSDDDLTLHEMMGKYDESYVYERETDILSDSDPTDCEDCGDTDADTGQDGGDEQDPDDLDFIDKDSFQDLNLSDSERGPRRLGHSNYYHFPNELSRKLSRHRDSSARRSTSGSRKRETAAKPRAPRRRRPRDPATRSLGGTPLSHRRKPLDDISEIRSHQSPVRMSVQRTLVIQDSRIDALKRRSNSVSYVSRTCAVKQSVPGGGFLANFDSEIALVEADKEADKKYKELILEAEHILVTMKASTPILGSPRRVMLNNPPPNKRVELLRNAECDLNPKVRGVDSVPGSPKLCGSPRFSPKKNHITNFMQINSPELSRRESNNNSSVNENIFSSPKKLLVHSPIVHKQVISKTIEPSRQSVRCPNSPRMLRRNVNTVIPTRNMVQSNQPGSPILQLNGRNISTNSPVCRPRTPQPVSQVLHIDDDSDESTEKEQISVHKKIDISKKSPKKGSFLGRTPPHKGDNAGYNNNLAGTSSSSDDAEQIKKDSTDNRPPLLTFRSIDIGHRVPDSGYCPQSEPVKRKVYSGSATFDRLQKSLDSHHLIRQKSDGEASTVDDQGTDECRAGLREKVARLRAERLDAEERSRHRTDLLQQQQGQFQKQLTLFRRQMLLQTIEGLKKSLEDQSASLNQTYNGNEVKKNQTYNGNEVKKKNIESF